MVLRSIQDEASYPATTNPSLSQRDELLQLLDKLKKPLVEGTISEDIYQELRTEYQEQLDDIQQKLKDS